MEHNKGSERNLDSRESSYCFAGDNSSPILFGLTIARQAALLTVTVLSCV